MARLKEPSRELALRILTEVDFEDRLTGFSLGERRGATPVTMYSFKEVVSLLHDPYPHIDFSELATWVRGIMGDQELADQVTETIEKGRTDQQRTHLIRELMETRLNQCRGKV